MGSVNLDNTGSGSAITLSSDGTSLLLDGTAIGGGGSSFTMIVENYSNGTAPSVTGNDAVGIGDNVTVSANDSYAIGHYATCAGAMSIALGLQANVTSGASQAVALGDNATVNAGTSGVALGTSYVSATDAFAAVIANNTSSYGATGANSIAIGQLSKATATNSIAIGDTATSTTANQIALGGTTDTVRISGTYTLPTADGSANQVLTTNGSGTVTFADAGGGGSDPDLYRDNASSATTPVASGTNAVAMGDTAVASGDNAFALGNDTDATGLNSLALGKGAQAVSTRCIAIGLNSSASADRSITIGNNGNVATATYATSIGSGSNGSGSTAAGSGSVALSNARAGGADSLAAVISNNTSSYGATGSYSMAGGYLNKATATDTLCWGGDSNLVTSGQAAVVGGWMNQAEGGYSFIGGGRNNRALATYSRAGGHDADTNDNHGKDVWASGDFSSRGDAQTAKRVLRSDTTDATAEALTTDKSTAGTTNQVILPNNSAYSFSGTIIARESAAAGSDYASWEIKGALLRDANAASTVLGNGIQNKLYATSGASAWAIALSADTTNGGLKIEVTGAASTNIRWVATVNTSEVTYA
jgi:hypothetical protein